MIELGLAIFVVLCATGILLALVLPRDQCPSIVAVLGSLAALDVVACGAAALAASYTGSLWEIPALGAVVIRLDALCGLLLVVTGVVFLAASLFAVDSVPTLGSRYSSRAYAALYFLLFVSIAWVLAAADVFSFLVAWEIMSITCYVLVALHCENEGASRAAYLMVALGEAGALAVAAALLLLAAHTGSLEFVELKSHAETVGSAMRWVIFLLTFFGFGVKAGLVPVNVWMSGAYTAAPAPFVPVLAGATLNLGLYGIFRVDADLLPPTSVGPGLVALAIGTLSALLGILYATTDNDLKTLLAHSSIENAGIITAGFGASLVFTADGKPMLAAFALLVALYHLVNHSLYKTLLFVGAGVVDERAGTRDLDRLGGLIRSMPWTSVFFLAGVLAIAALPPFNGFVSEWLTLQTMLRAAELSSIGVKIVFAICGAGLALTAALAVTCFAKVFAMGFLGMTRSEDAEGATDANRPALAAMGILAVLCLLLGVTPTYFIAGLDHVAHPIAGASATDALVPPFFAGTPGHQDLPGPFLAEFHDLGAEVGETVLPGPGLVIMHRGGRENPVVFAGAPSYLIVVLAGLLVVSLVVVRSVVARRRAVARRACWDGGIRRLLPEMTYTATGFSNPVRVIFQAIFRPTIVEDTRETVAEHFRTAIRHEREEVHILDRLVFQPSRRAVFRLAGFLARMHHGQLNAYVTYGLLSLILVLLLLRLFQRII